MNGVRRRVVFWTALMLAATSLAWASYIPLKATLAQLLLNWAWEKRQASDVAVRPWPWADTLPLARLTQPRLAVDQVVLAGASGRVLAFGPGHVTGTAAPGTRGNSVISAHRDTHFRWLAEVRRGDHLRVETPRGVMHEYEIVTTRVHHASDGYLLDPALGPRLTLITCYPFDAVDPGTPLRYVVSAVPRTM